MGSGRTLVSDRIKLVYVAPRPKGVGHAEFRARWRRHAALMMGQPIWEHMDFYQQGDTLAPEQVGIPPEAFAGMGGTVEPGGIGLIGVRSSESLDTVLGSDLGPAVRQDEVDIFGRELGADVIACSEHVVIDRAAPVIGGFGLVNRQPALSHKEFADRWVANGPHFVAATETSKHVARYSLNIAIEEGSYDGMVEFGFASAEDLIGFVTSPVDQVMAAESSILDFSDFHLVLTANHTLYAEPAAPLVTTA